MNNTKIIVFEGPDGSGKTTQINLLISWLKNEKIDYFYGKARVKPTDEYKLICEIENKSKEFPKSLKASLIAYERCKQLFHIINNNKGKVVIIDKYIYSTEIYLKYKGINSIDAEKILSWLPKPDIVFYFNLDPAICMERIIQRNEQIGNNENVEFLTLLNNHLCDKITESGVDIFHIDATDSVMNINNKIITILSNKLRIN